jgi:glutaminyl-tRNA synthetase
VQIENNPLKPEEGARSVSSSRHLWIENTDFEEVPPKKYNRLYPGNEVRLKGAYVVRCTGCVKDRKGHITEVLCEYDPDSRGGDPADGRKIKGTIHWVDEATAINAEVRLYDSLFSDPDPDGAGKDFMDYLNPSSLITLEDCKLEACLAEARAPERCQSAKGFQFLRTGYFCPDTECRPDHLVFNRVVALKDSYKK